MALKCTYEGCLYAEQQVCSRTGNPSPCEFVQEFDDQPSSTHASGEADLPLPVEAKSTVETGIHTGQELGLAELSELMDEQYGTLITVLGDYKAGKTSFLVCLYLACACGMFEDRGWTFAGSLTLPGFEARARSGRRWSAANPPDRMTERTVLGDDRNGGFLHLDLTRSSSGRTRLLMSDLPGEWTKDLIGHARFGYRFEFLARSDAIIIMIDGEHLVGKLRHSELERNRILVDRIADILGKSRPLLKLVATRADKIGQTPPKALLDLAAYAREKGFVSEARVICTFSQDEATSCGLGTIELLESCISSGNRPRVEQVDTQVPSRLFGWLPVTCGGVS